MYSSSWIVLAVAAMAQAATHIVQVGMNSTGGLATVYSPNSITADEGDIIEFHFRAKNHTVTQSSFAEPCTQQFNTATNLPGVDSGFMPVAANATEIPTFSIKLLDATSPQWFFCNQANHCNSGMLFAINAPASGPKTFDAFVANAANATHPDPALRQTAPFTPTPAAASSSVDPNAAPSVDPNASSSDPGATLTDSATAIVPAASASPSISAGTDVPVNAAPSVSSSGLNLSLGSASATASTTASADASHSAGFRMQGSRALMGTLIVGLMGGFIL